MQKQILIVILSLLILTTEQISLAFSKEEVQVLSDVLTTIKTSGAQKDITDTKLTDGMLKGMLQSVDAHSEYFTKDEYLKLQESISGKFYGIGVFIEIKDSVLYVSGTISGMPAQKVGVKNGDYITHIDDVSTFGLSVLEASNKLKGKKGTKVKVKVFRKDNKDPIDFTIIRDMIDVKSVAMKKIGDFLYIGITYFTDDTYKEFISELKKQKDYKGIIIDVRSNPGGVLDGALALSSLFLNKGETIMQYLSPVDSNKNVYEEKCMGYKKLCRNLLFQTNGEYVTIKNNDEPLIKNVPIVALVNQYSASASEIVSFALHENKKAVVIGQKTFGKGSVQSIIPLQKGERGAMKLTTALYFSPKGNMVQTNGLTPDIVIPEFEVKTVEKRIGFLPERESDYKNHIKIANENLQNSDEIPSNIEDFALQIAISSLKTSITQQNANQD
jgi:carboxyl-terminal processing protease